MSEPVYNSTFTAYLHTVSLTSGRITFRLKDSAEDVGQAATLVFARDAVLLVKIRVGEDELCAFQAIIPKIQRALQFTAAGGTVHFEVPETELRNILPLIGHEDTPVKLECGIAGAQVKAAKKEKEATPHGAFWQALVQSGFMVHPDMQEVFYQLREANHRPPEYPAEQIIRDLFSVASRAEISPARLRDWLKVRRLPGESGAWVLIDQAERKAGK